jgi:RNA polymerase sigma factor (sigma-70 family)
MMNSRTEAEDMLQESFAEAFARLDSYRFESSFGAWLKKIVIHKCINELNRKKTVLEFIDDLEPLAEPVETEEEARYMEGITVEKVMHAMTHLPRGSRMIFSLYLLEGYDHEEISQILQISESNSKSQFMRARQKMKSILTNLPHEN